MPAMRDVFFNSVFEMAKKDRNIVILSADFSAPSLDKFRLELPSQYIFMGISEQNMMLVAAGLALEGKRPICYAIAPFLTLRCFEQTKLYASGMNLPITLVGVGAGVAYNDSGYTHHAIEDIALMRTLAHMRIFQPCDNEDVKQMTDLIFESQGPIYLRLDRYAEESLFVGSHTVRNTFSISKEIRKVTVVSSGSMMKIAEQLYRDMIAEGIDIGVINVNIIPMNEDKFIDIIREANYLVTIEEHSLIGGLGSYVLELVSQYDIPTKVKRIGFDLSDGYIDEFGTREEIYESHGIDVSSVKKEIMKLIKGIRV